MTVEESRAAPLEWDELWRTVNESLLGGIHHALNNRVAALSAIAQVLGAGMPDAAPIVASLGGEVARLEGTVGLIALLRRARSRAAEPVQIPELVSSLGPLLPHHPDLKEIEFASDPDPGILPVYAERDQLTRVMLTLLTSSGLSAECAGGGRVRIAYSGDQDEVVTRIACEPSPREGGSTSPTARPLDARGAAGAVRDMKGKMLSLGGETDGPIAYEIRLPTLLAARRSEAAAPL